MTRQTAKGIRSRRQRSGRESRKDNIPTGTVPRRPLWTQGRIRRWRFVLAGFGRSELPRPKAREQERPQSEQHGAGKKQQKGEIRSRLRRHGSALQINSKAGLGWVSLGHAAAGRLNGRYLQTRW